MREIILKDGESRKDYLLRVCAAYIEMWPEETLIFDEAKCDGHCLIEDINIVVDTES